MPRKPKATAAILCAFCLEQLWGEEHRQRRKRLFDEIRQNVPEFQAADEEKFLEELLAAMVETFCFVWTQGAVFLKALPREYATSASLCLVFFLKRVIPEPEERERFQRLLQVYSQAVAGAGDAGINSFRAMAQEVYFRTVGPSPNPGAIQRLEQKLDTLGQAILADVSRYKIVAEGDPQDLEQAPLSEWG
jgi:hypothetical protein